MAKEKITTDPALDPGHKQHFFFSKSSPKNKETEGEKTHTLEVEKLPQKPETPPPLSFSDLFRCVSGGSQLRGEMTHGSAPDH